MLVIQRAIGFGRGVLFCRWLDPAEFGRWGLAYLESLLRAADAAASANPSVESQATEESRS